MGAFAVAGLTSWKLATSLLKAALSELVSVLALRSCWAAPSLSTLTSALGRLRNSCPTSALAVAVAASSVRLPHDGIVLRLTPSARQVGAELNLPILRSGADVAPSGDLTNSSTNVTGQIPTWPSRERALYQSALTFLSRTTTCPAESGRSPSVSPAKSKSARPKQAPELLSISAGTDPLAAVSVQSTITSTYSVGNSPALPFTSPSVHSSSIWRISVTSSPTRSESSLGYWAENGNLARPYAATPELRLW